MAEDAGIFVILERLSKPLRDLHDTAFKLAHEELRVRTIDSSVYLLAILRVGDSDPMVKWLHSTGITDKKVAEFIKANFESRRRDKKEKDPWGGTRSTENPPSYTAAARTMFEKLQWIRVGRPVHSAFVAKLLEAVVVSDSQTVVRIFADVGIDVADVRRQMGTYPDANAIGFGL